MVKHSCFGFERVPETFCYPAIYGVWESTFIVVLASQLKPPYWYSPVWGLAVSGVVYTSERQERFPADLFL